MIVPSSDGVEVAVHDLGGDGAPLLVSHATGFHGRCYLPLAAALGGHHHSIAFDYRGHGDTPRPDVEVDWWRYSDDTVAVATWLANDGPVDAFGHSMGGACLLMAAHRHPELFARLVLFEPIVFPPAATSGDRPNGMAEAARRRRSTFHTFQAAYDNFASKPPLNAFTPEALHSYVDFGFARDAHGVHLKCTPDTEAATFDAGTRHTTWDLLDTIDTEVVVVSGVVEAMRPSGVAGAVADRLPNARYLEFPHLDHFGPMTHPAELAGVIDELLGR